jgi:hypothetical protein
MNIELLEDATAVSLDGLDADAQRASDVGILMALDDKAKNLALAFGQDLEELGRSVVLFAKSLAQIQPGSDSA